MSSSTEPLHLKWRPSRFDDMVGQRYVSGVLRRMVETQRVPVGLLFAGPSGTGETTAARILAHEVGADDVIEVDAASHGGVDEIRAILATLRYSTAGGDRVVIFDEAQSISEKGFEVLLKTLEEPPAHTIFVLTTTAPHKIPEMVASRLIEFSFRSLTAGDIAARLAHVAVSEQIKIERDLAIHLANRSDGNMRSALQELDRVSRAGMSTLREFIDAVGDGDPAPALFAALMNGNHAVIFSVLEEQLAAIGSPGQISAELIGLIRDLFVLKAGGKLPEGQRNEVRKQLSVRIDNERLLLIVKVLWDVRTKIRSSEDPRGSLELALVLISEVLVRANPARMSVPAVPSEQPKAAAPRKLSLAEMQRD